MPCFKSLSALRSKPANGNYYKRYSNNQSLFWTNYYILCRIDHDESYSLSLCI